MPAGPTGKMPVLRLYEPREDLIRFLERFLAPDVEPGAFDLECLYGLALVEPLNESPGLVRIISGGDVGREKRDDLAREIVECDSGHRILRFRWLLFELGDYILGISRDAGVLLHRFQIADIVDRQHRFGSFRGGREIRERFAEEIIAGHDN